MKQICCRLFILACFCGPAWGISGKTCYTIKGTARLIPDPSCKVLDSVDKFPFGKGNDFYFAGTKEAEDEDGNPSCFSSEFKGSLINTSSPIESYSLNGAAIGYSGVLRLSRAKPAFPAAGFVPPMWPGFMGSAATMLKVEKARSSSGKFQDLSFTLYSIDLFAATITGYDREQLVVTRIEGDERLSGAQGVIWIEGPIFKSEADVNGEICKSK